jgi:hypothetical protein
MTGLKDDETRVENLYEDYKWFVKDTLQSQPPIQKEDAHCRNDTSNARLSRRAGFRYGLPLRSKTQPTQPPALLAMTCN